VEFYPDIKYRNLPVVVLAGRPNVGKSTLFNRLLHQRRAITDPTPGVTRDPIAQDAFIAGKPLRLVDTGGFKLDRSGIQDSDGLDDLVVGRTEATLAEADLIVLLLEAGTLTNEDEEFIEYLRPYQDRLLVTVNKTEGGRREAEAWNLLAYGFDQVFMISAEHGDNVAELEEAIAARIDCLPVVYDDAETRPIRIALLGKPNTGKSTLSNRLTSTEASIVSDIPGTTRDVVEGEFTWKNRRFQVLDTAGIRRKAKVTENVEYYSVNRAIGAIDDADIVILLIDAVEGLADQDKKIAALACDRGRGVILVLNKWDTMPPVKNAFNAARDRVRFLFGQMEYAPVIALSALDGTGAGELLDTALKMYTQLTRHTDTPALNAALERWMTESPPPSGPQTRFKVRYAVQVSENPVKFVFFVSRPQAVTEPYITYLCNKIRRDLGYAQIPVQIEIRATRENRSGKPKRDGALGGASGGTAKGAARGSARRKP
jgi:GTP-binding protein